MALALLVSFAVAAIVWTGSRQFLDGFGNPEPGSTAQKGDASSAKTGGAPAAAARNGEGGSASALPQTPDAAAENQRRESSAASMSAVSSEQRATQQPSDSVASTNSSRASPTTRSNAAGSRSGDRAAQNRNGASRDSRQAGGPLITSWSGLAIVLMLIAVTAAVATLFLALRPPGPSSKTPPRPLPVRGPAARPPRERQTRPTEPARSTTNQPVLDATRLRYVAPSLFVDDGGWKVIAASVAGTSHQKNKLPCQDAAYCRIPSRTVLIGAVADGAGSARHSDEGAQLAVKKAVDSLAELLEHTTVSQAAPPELKADQWHQLLRSAMMIALSTIELRAAMSGAPSREFATTLLLFAALPQSVVAAQVGDGAVVVRDDRNQLHALTTPQTGEYANTTTFLVSPDAFKTVQHQVWRGPYRGVAAFTDGLQRLALSMPRGEPHGPFFAPLFDFVERADDGRTAIDEIDAFLRSGKVTERADDDLTLLVAWMKP